MKSFKHIKIYSILAMCLTLGASASASGINSKIILKIVKQQVQSIHWHTLNDSNEWGFTIETQLDRGDGKLQQRIQRFDPNLELNQQWQLIEQDKKGPSKAVLHEYAKTQSSIRDEEHEVSSENVEIVHLVTLALETDSKDYAIFSFKPRLPMFDDEVNKVFDGKLYFNKTTNYIEKLTIRASESFSPGFSFEVEKYNLKIDVSKIGEQLHVTQLESHKSGSAFIFSSFDEISTRKLSRFVIKNGYLETN